MNEVTILGYIRDLLDIIKDNIESIQKLDFLVQAIGRTSYRAMEKTTHNFDVMSNIFRQTMERFELIEFMQDAQLELIQIIAKISMYSIVIDGLHTIAITVLAICVIRLNKKIKEKNNVT